MFSNSALKTVTHSAQKIRFKIRFWKSENSKEAPQKIEPALFWFQFPCSCLPLPWIYVESLGSFIVFEEKSIAAQWTGYTFPVYNKGFFSIISSFLTFFVYRGKGATTLRSDNGSGNCSDISWSKLHWMVSNV